MPELDGILTFYSSHHALRAERVLQLRGVPVRTVPCPRELSSSCGVALRFPFTCHEQVREWLAQAGVQVESLVRYPEARAAPAGWGSMLARLRRRQGPAVTSAGPGKDTRS